MKLITPILLVSAISLLLAGCGTCGFDKANCTSDSLQKDAKAIDQSNLQLDAVVVTLTDLMNNPGPDMKPQFKNFSSAVDKLESSANEVNRQVGAMQVQGAEYFQKWDEELAKIHNEDIRTRSADRKTLVAARFAKVKASYVQAKTNFDPFMSDLKDIRTALATDLTSAGLVSVKGVVIKANNDATPLHESLSNLAAGFKELGNSISAKTPVQ